MFSTARWRLTGWYVLIISLISLTFSTIIYKIVGIEIDRLALRQRIRWERSMEIRGLPYELWEPDLAAESKNRMLMLLVMVNGGIVLIGGGMAFWLSGVTLRPIKDMVEEQSRFVADASHELKTPLTSLKSSFEVFLRDPKPAKGETKKLIYESIGEVDRLQKLIEGLLSLAKYKSKQPDAGEKVQLKELVLAVVSKYKQSVGSKKIRVTTKLGDYIIKGRREELGIIINNLIDNAIKYSPKGGKINISTKYWKGMIRLDVQDSGLGIEKSDLPHIFNRFYRADNARSRLDTGGYGLGLALVKKIADDMGAKIFVESKIAKGSTFSVVFQKD